MKKQTNRTPKKEIGMKEMLLEWLEMKSSDLPKPKNNREEIIQGLIREARKGNSQALKTIFSITGEEQGLSTPKIEIEVVDNTRLEKFLYMTDEEYQKFEEEHKNQKEYKITCLNKEARMKLEKEFEGK